MITHQMVDAGKFALGFVAAALLAGGLLFFSWPLESPPADDRALFGVLHSVHTRFSDGVMSQAQRVGELKRHYGWAATVDHDVRVDDGEWTALRDEARKNNVDGVFTYFPGYEWKGAAAGGSEVTVFFVDDGPQSKVDGVDPGYDTFDGLIGWLKENNGIGCVNHPARAGNAVDWGSFESDYEHYLPCVEMLNKVYYHWNDFWNCSAGSGCATYRNPRPDGSVWAGGVLRGLERGRRLGFVAGWDHHGIQGTPTAYTGLANPYNRSREGIFETIRARHTWAAEARIVMDVRSGTKIMGDAFAQDAPTVRIVYNMTAEAGHIISETSLFLDGVIVNVTKHSTKNAYGTSEVTVAPGREHFIFYEAVEDDGKRGWSSPMYVTYHVPDSPA